MVAITSAAGVRLGQRLSEMSLRRLVHAGNLLESQRRLRQQPWLTGWSRARVVAVPEAEGGEAEIRLSRLLLWAASVEMQTGRATAWVHARRRGSLATGGRGHSQRVLRRMSAGVTSAERLAE